MDLLQISLIFSAVLCSLVTGFLFAFAVVVMPGIRNLSNMEFILAFQAMDGIIQNNQPIFLATWLGSIIALIIAAALGIGHLDATESWLLIFSTFAYLLGVQLPTFTINIPLNKRLQSLNVDSMDKDAQKAARETFETRWNRWNAIRTVFSFLASTLLIVLIFRY